MKVYDAKPSFAAGEVSPLLYGRVDMDRYAVGARFIENFIVLPQGGLINRPGTARAATLSESRVRLAPFVFNEGDAYCLVFAPGYIVVLSGTSEIARIGSPYGYNHLPQLRWLQSGDVLYLFHRDVPVHALVRYSMSSWGIEGVELKNGPFQDLNTSNIKMRIIGSYLYSDTNYFKSYDYAGSLVKFETKIKAQSGEEELGRVYGGRDIGWYEQWSVTIKNWFGAFTWATTGKWGGVLTVYRCPIENWRDKEESQWEWEIFKTYQSDGGDNGSNYSFSGSIEEYSTHFRFVFDNTTGTAERTSQKMKFNWSFDGGMIQRVVRIDSVVGQSFCRVTPVDKIRGDVAWTTDWALGAFGAHFGYPAMGCFHQERLILANTPANPQSIWMSKPASWHDFGTSIPAKDDDSIAITLASKRISEIRGLASRSDLLIFTGGGEWTAKSGAKSDVFTPSSIVVTPSGYRGSAWIEPLDVGSSTLFVQQHGASIRGLSYSLEADDYASGDLTILASHLFDGLAVAGWAYQQEPWSLVWVALSSGALLTLTLQQEHQVTAWSRQNVGGSVVDLCSIPGSGRDELYMAVRRGASMCIERIKHRIDTTFDVGAFTDAHGAAVVATLETLDWEAPLNGSIQARHRALQNVTMRLHRTCGLKIGVMTENNSKLDDLRMQPGIAPGPISTPVSGDFRIPVPGGLGTTCRLRVVSDGARPVTITGIFPELVVTNGA